MTPKKNGGPEETSGNLKPPPRERGKGPGALWWGGVFPLDPAT